MRDRILKLTPIHASVIYQIQWIHWIHWISVSFRENFSITTYISGDEDDDVEVKQTQVSQYESMQISAILQKNPVDTDIDSSTNQESGQWFVLSFYRPQKKLRKGNVFTSACQEFCPRGRGALVVSASGCGGRGVPLPPPGRQPPRQTSPWEDTGWYASYCNAFLYLNFMTTFLSPFCSANGFTVGVCVCHYVCGLGPLLLISVN